MGEILVLCGFFMIYIVEEVTHIVIDKFMPEKKGHVRKKRKLPFIRNTVFFCSAGALARSRGNSY